MSYSILQISGFEEMIISTMSLIITLGLAFCYIHLFIGGVSTIFGINRLNSVIHVGISLIGIWIINSDLTVISKLGAILAALLGANNFLSAIITGVKRASSDEDSKSLFFPKVIGRIQEGLLTFLPLIKVNSVKSLRLTMETLRRQGKNFS